MANISPKVFFYALWEGGMGELILVVGSVAVTTTIFHAIKGLSTRRRKVWTAP
ncbi:hypothetical protein KJ785_04035 [Patescibacteria group bacterium]|nr:hypothetical protein [Patescibacteria group bacterium]